MSAYCRVCFTIKAEKNISLFIVENKEDLLIYLRLKSLIALHVEAKHWEDVSFIQ
jgi:hypothetical protein